MNCKRLQTLLSFSISVLNTPIHFYELHFYIGLLHFLKIFSIANEIYENIWFLLSQFISELRLIAKESDDSGAYFKNISFNIVILGRHLHLA